MGKRAEQRPHDRKEFGVRDPTKASVTAQEWEREGLGRSLGPEGWAEG